MGSAYAGAKLLPVNAGHERPKHHRHRALLAASIEEGQTLFLTDGADGSVPMKSCRQHESPPAGVIKMRAIS